MPLPIKNSVALVTTGPLASDSLWPRNLLGEGPGLPSTTLQTRGEPRKSSASSNNSEPKMVESLVQQTVDVMGKLDIVISNAGWTKFADFYDLNQNVDEAVWDHCFSANVKSHLFLLHAAREHL
ncbi:hypothetical protein BHE90_006061 [Fusarium euwallaceae]|uniref:Uncharacterized protein n=1 Tax=Fusarium euwallaceae TaxID=1147111 RepID=A0A430LUP4_9HYPO|nr:hypothetical protein BHE90_006061 [Fusarium euwallaceae]